MYERDGDRGDDFQLCNLLLLQNGIILFNDLDIRKKKYWITRTVRGFVQNQ